MRVAVGVAVTQLFHQLGGRVAQVHGHFAAFVLLDEGAGLVVGVVAGVAFGSHGQVDDGLAQRQLALGAAQALVGQGGVVGDLHGARVSQANVLPGHAHDAARQVARVGAAVQHAGQPVERSIGVRAAHRLVQRRDLVVKIVAAFVEAARGEAQRVLRELGRDVCDAGRLCGGLRLLQQVQKAACVAIGVANQRVARHVVERQVGQGLGLRAGQQLAQFLVAERLEHVNLRA